MKGSFTGAFAETEQVSRSSRCARPGMRFRFEGKCKEKKGKIASNAVSSDGVKQTARPGQLCNIGAVTDRSITSSGIWLSPSLLPYSPSLPHLPPPIFSVAPRPRYPPKPLDSPPDSPGICILAQSNLAGQRLTLPEVPTTPPPRSLDVRCWTCYVSRYLYSSACVVAPCCPVDSKWTARSVVSSGGGRKEGRKGSVQGKERHISGTRILVFAKR